MLVWNLYAATELWKLEDIVPAAGPRMESSWLPVLQKVERKQIQRFDRETWEAEEKEKGEGTRKEKKRERVTETSKIHLK